MAIECANTNTTYDVSAENAKKLMSGRVRTDLSKLNETQLPTYMLTGKDGKERPILAADLIGQEGFTAVKGPVKPGDIIVYHEKGSKRAYFEFVADTEGGKVNAYGVSKTDIALRQRGAVMNALKVDGEGARTISAWGCYGETEIVVLRQDGSAANNTPPTGTGNDTRNDPPSGRGGKATLPAKPWTQSETEKAYHETRTNFGKALEANQKTLTAHEATKPRSSGMGGVDSKALAAWTEEHTALQSRQATMAAAWTKAEKKREELSKAVTPQAKDKVMAEVTGILKPAMALTTERNLTLAGPPVEKPLVKVEVKQIANAPSKEDLDTIKQYHESRLKLGELSKNLAKMIDAHKGAEPDSKADAMGSKSKDWRDWDATRKQYNEYASTLSQVFTRMEQDDKKFRAAGGISNQASIARAALSSYLAPAVNKGVGLQQLAMGQ